MERMKMPRSKRAVQFAPFDALKGLTEALRLKEYQHNREIKGEISEEQASKISKILINLEKTDIIEVKYFVDNHYITIRGNVKLLIDKQAIQVRSQNLSPILILLDDVADMNKIG